MSTIPLVVMRVYRPGMNVRYRNENHTIEYTQVSKDMLYLKLKGISELVKDSLVECDPIQIDFNR